MTSPHLSSWHSSLTLANPEPNPEPRHPYLTSIPRTTTSIPHIEPPHPYLTLIKQATKLTPAPPASSMHSIWGSPCVMLCECCQSTRTQTLTPQPHRDLTVSIGSFITTTTTDLNLPLLILPPALPVGLYHQRPLWWGSLLRRIPCFHKGLIETCKYVQLISPVMTW